MRLLRAAPPFIYFTATVLFDHSETGQFVLGPGDFPIGNLAPRLFLRSFVGFSLNPLTLMFRALPGRLLLLLMPSLLFHAERGLGCDSRGFAFRTTRFFFLA